MSTDDRFLDSAKNTSLKGTGTKPGCVQECSGLSEVRLIAAVKGFVEIAQSFEFV